MKNENAEVIKDFLSKAEARWPLTVARNREAAMEWVELLRRMGEQEFAANYEKIIKAYENPA